MYPSPEELSTVVDNLADMGDYFDPIGAIHLTHLAYNRHLLLGESLIEASNQVVIMAMQIKSITDLAPADEFQRLRLLIMRILCGLFLGIEESWVEGKTQVLSFDSFDNENMAVVVYNDMVFI